MDPLKPYRFLAWSKPVGSRRSASFSLIIFATALLALSGCNRTGEESGSYPIAYNTSGLPNVTLTDQYGQHVSLASLKGKPVLFDFIYTSCPGPCQNGFRFLFVDHQTALADVVTERGGCLGRSAASSASRQIATRKNGRRRPLRDKRSIHAVREAGTKVCRQ